MRTINMLDLAAEFELVGADVRQAIDRVWSHQKFVGGPEVVELERRLAELCDRRFAVAISNGTDAITCALMAAGIRPDDEVIVPPFTFFATAGCVHRLGARPVFVDVEPDTFNMDATQLAAAITPRTRAVIPVHLFGQSADMEPIEQIARRHADVFVLADAAQAIGATYRGRAACAWGDAATLSFYPTKNLGAFGEGGMIVTDDQKLADRCRSLRNHGQSALYRHEEVGGNFRLDTLQAAVLLAKLDHWPQFQQARQHHAGLYDALLADTPLYRPVVRETCRSVYHQYTVVCDDRDSLAAHLKSRGVGTAVYYPIPLHLQPCFADLGHGTGDFPVSEALARTVLSLPVHPMLSDEDVSYVAEAIRDSTAPVAAGASPPRASGRAVHHSRRPDDGPAE